MRGSALVCLTFTSIVFLLYDGISGEQNSTHITQIVINDILTRADSRTPPTLHTGESVISRVQIFLQSIDSVNEYSMDFSASFFLRQRWFDERLAFSTGNISRVELDIATMSSVWVPDIFIVNEKKADIHRVTMPNKLMHVYNSGLVVYSLRISGKYACEMDLHKYPHDDQICKLVMESYGYSAETLSLRWQRMAAEKVHGTGLPQFEIEKLTSYICDETHADVKYTCIGLNIHLRRSYGFYIIQIYIPSILIVSLSWLSFWLSIDAIPARISLGLLTVLTMTTQSSSARASLPRVSYIKAIDVWMSTCLTFVFMALIEFAYVNFLATGKFRKRQNDATKADPNIAKEENVHALGKFSPTKRSNKEQATLVDRVSRILFPSVFLFFNIVYWVAYTS